MKRLLALLFLFCSLACPAEAMLFRGGSFIPSSPPGSTLVLPGTPVAVYSTLRYQGWNGNCLRVQRSSDSTQLDIGFDGTGYVDIASATTFAGASQLSVVTWYDESGNSNDATSTGNPPAFRAANAMGGHQPVTFTSATLGNGSGFLSIPATVSLSRQAYTVYEALGIAGGLVDSLSFFGLGTSATTANNASILYDNAGAGHTRWLDSAFHVPATYNRVGVPTTAGLFSDGTTVTLRADGGQATASAASAVTLTGGFIGKSAWTGAPISDYESFALVIYGSAISGSDATSIETAFNTAFSVPDISTSRQVINDGDSITAGYINTDYMLNFVRVGIPSLDNNPKVYDIAVSGALMCSIVSNGRANGRYDAGLTTNIDHIFAGTNDISILPSGGIVGGGTTIYNDCLLPYIQARIAQGYKVVVGTMLPRQWTGSATDISQKETERLAYNSLIISNAVGEGYTVADYAGIYPVAATYISGSVDGIHPSTSQYSSISTVYIAAVNPLLTFNFYFSRYLSRFADNSTVLRKINRSLIGLT